MKNVAVIGAGITGITTAYYLAKAGYQVTVIEQERYPAMQCSFANGGQISVSNSEVWTTWTNVKKGLKWITKKDAPLLIRPSLDLDKIHWLWHFLKNTYNNKYYDNTSKTIQLGLESRLLYNNLIADENLKFDQSSCGILHFYKNESELKLAESASEIYNKFNVEWDLISKQEVCHIEPHLKANNILGGVWTKSDWTGDIHKFCNNLSTILQNKYKVKFLLDFKVNTIQELISYDKIVVCAGVNSAQLAKSIGDNLLIYPVKGYSITIQAANSKVLSKFPKVSLIDDNAKIVTSTLGNRLRVAGTAELAGYNYDIRRDRIKPLLSWVNKNFPHIDTRNYMSWACLRPMTPDMLPIVKQSDNNHNVYYNTGHGHLGWTLSPATAVQLTNLISNESERTGNS